ncbi:hypothetical protein F5Y00DRAFT_266029 [Daldinia vernicosa]|uniref:uncharacterized protein n=1 Tax=Daldinia vernicosa TaxID=114800 RepID=UPI0020080704|nr:uncharacterized protein F5Y00DRAFT_266029 [Daldinia vernicosa]KAI0844937.1 hypothetical protein F5Y00DRAFT_266029 [Daldinia vernicosa]
MNVPFKTSSEPGTVGGFETTLGKVSNVTYSILPPQYDGGLHNAPYAQWVYFTTGLAYITLPDDKDTSTLVNGGQFGLIFAADTAAVSQRGHRTQYPGVTESIVLQIPTSDGKVPEHNVLHMGPCDFNEVSGARGVTLTLENRECITQGVKNWANNMLPFISC